MEQMNINEVEQILAKRAARYAAAAIDHRQKEILGEIAVVAVGAEKLGIFIRQLAYIVETPSIALLPHMPPYLDGIVQYRGDIFSVVNIARWFSIKGASAGNVLAVLESERGKLGILIDAVLGFQTIYADDVARHLVQPVGASRHPISLVTRNTVAVLDIDQLLDHDEITVDL